VVFGGTGDIGGAIAARLHRAGWTVESVSRNAPPSGKSPYGHFAADAGSEEAVAAAIGAILETGPIDAVVYAVGLAPDVQVPLSEYQTADWRRTFSAYVDGLFHAYKAAFPHLEPGAHFMVISSAITALDLAEPPPFHAGHYAAAKGAVDQFSRWARVEAHGRGVLFSRLAPGSVRSAARAVLGIPEPQSLPLDAVAEKVVDALVGQRELDEVMLQPGGI
jgi:3-oxoacyl-[acyl-carrier protein] reductase